MIRSINSLAVGIILGFGSLAQAQNYNFTFTDGGVSATGSFSETGGLVTTGEVSVTGAALNGTFDLVSPPTVRALDGTDIIFDNLFSPSSNPSLDSGGLGFASGFISTAHYQYVVDIWGNGPGNYSLFEAGQSDRAGDGHVYNEYDGGSFTATAVPDACATFGLLGSALAGLQAIRRKLLC